MKLEDLLEEKYYEAICEKGLDYSPEEFLEDFDVMELDTHEAGSYIEQMYSKVAEDYPLLDYDSNRMGELVWDRIEEQVRDYNPKKLEDVRYDELDRQQESKDPYGYRGLSKSDFYP